VLKGKSSEVSEATSDRILEKVKQLGYVKNLTASSLSGRQSHMIAVIIIGVFEPHEANLDPDINPFYGELVFRLDRAARGRGYTLCLYTGREEEYISFLLERNVDAAVMVGLAQSDLPSVLQRHQAPIILMDTFDLEEGVMNVRNDELLGGALAARHLIERGRKKLAFAGELREEFPNNIPAKRYEGALRACEEAGLPLARVVTWTSMQDAEKIVPQLIELGVDGVVTAADILAAGILNGLDRAGVKVPDDIAVIGYDNVLVSRMSKPALSTIDQNLNEKVKAVIDLVVDGKPGALREIEPKLIVREST